jgi:hypothetical protein
VKQEQVQKDSKTVQNKNEVKANAEVVKDRINRMTPEQLEELGKQVPLTQ